MCLSPIDVLEKPTLRVDLKFNKTTKKPVQITIINEGKEISKTAMKDCDKFLYDIIQLRKKYNFEKQYTNINNNLTKKILYSKIFKPLKFYIKTLISFNHIFII